MAPEIEDVRICGLLASIVALDEETGCGWRTQRYERYPGGFEVVFQEHSSRLAFIGGAGLSARGARR